MSKSKYHSFFLFISFVVAAAILWFLFRYNNIYEEYTDITINWTNIPADVKLDDSARSIQVPVKIKASGFELLWLKYSKVNTSISFKDYTVEKDGVFLFEPREARNHIDRSLGNGINVIEMDGAVMSLDYERFTSKMVPILQNFELKFGGNYQQVGERGFDVDSVKITGNDAVVDQMTRLSIDREDIIVNDSIVKTTIDLGQLYPNLKMEPSNVVYTVEAAQMTEGSFKIPVTVVNKDQDLTIQLIPDIVTVVYSSRLLDYDSITKDDFKVMVDVRDLKAGETTVAPNLIVDSEKINEARVQPQSVQILVIQ